MVHEQMVELSILERITKNLDENENLYFNGVQLDPKKIVARYNELMREFLKPYVIDKTPRGD